MEATCHTSMRVSTEVLICPVSSQVNGVNGIKV